MVLDGPEFTYDNYHFENCTDGFPYKIELRGTRPAGKSILLKLANGLLSATLARTTSPSIQYGLRRPLLPRSGIQIQ
jgi:hypothetical protein